MNRRRSRVELLGCGLCMAALNQALARAEAAEAEPRELRSAVR